MSGPDAFAAAHARLLRDPRFQFDFDPSTPPRPPDWLVAVFNWLFKGLHVLGPGLMWIVWGVLVAVVLAILAALVGQALRASQRAPKLGSLSLRDGPDGAVAARGAALDPEGLARARRYAEAIHQLLLSAFAALAARRPGLVAPAMTSREIARLDGLPGEVRPPLSRLAQAVEASLFGGRAADEADFQRCLKDRDAAVSALAAP